MTKCAQATSRARTRVRRVDFLIDTGEGIGSGHYVRCLALAEELLALNSSCEIQAFLRCPVPGFSTPTSLPVRNLVESRSGCPHADLVICDGDKSDWAPTLSTLSRRTRLVRITDNLTVVPPADLIICPNFAEFPRSHHVLAGPQWIILRPQFDNPPRRSCGAGARKLLICLGGQTDQTLLARIVASLQEVAVAIGLREAVVVAPPEIVNTVDAEFSVRAAYPVEDMLDLMLSADMGIIGGGTMLYEAMVTGLPSTVVSITKDQAREATTAAEQGACLHVPVPERLENLGASVAALAPAEVRQAIGAAGQRLVDGGGRRRVAQAILQLLSGEEESS